jgi:Flp pilus assembly protein TadG
MMLLFGIIELAMIFLVSTSLDNATANAARTIRTGQLQTAGGATATTFKTTICNNLGWLSSTCGSNLSVDVRTYAKFNDITLSDPIVNKTFNAAALTFQPGNPEDIVVVRAYYQWTLFTPLLSGAVQKLNGGNTLLTSTLAFRNEPYS